MKEIFLKFLTTKGVKAYEQSEAEGKARPKAERRLVKCLFKDSIISKDPLIVKIKIRSQRMAVQVNLPRQIEEGLKLFGAKKDKDYEMKIK